MGVTAILPEQTDGPATRGSLPGGGEPLVTVNSLYYGDNLAVLREGIATESVDLIYLDPPFNSQATYNLLFKSPTGAGSQAQIEAFEDTWHWGLEAQDAFDQVIQSGNTNAADMLRSVRTFLGDNDMMAYLAMMAVRLLELHRVLKPTGSLYLHCDPTASHYLKILLDAVFTPLQFRNEITWKRSTSHGNVGRNYGNLSDEIFFYTKSDKYTWVQQYADISAEYAATKFNSRDPDGRRWQSVSLRNPSVRPNLQFDYTASDGRTYTPHPNGWAVGRERLEKYDKEKRLHFPAKPDGQLRVKQYLDERPGTRLQNIWDDIPAINSQAQERLGYPTQKPVALLDRILSTSSNPGDVVLDPFCGCGTAVHSAQKLGRPWIGIDVTHLAISLIERRLKDAFPEIKFEVHGTPKDLDGARDLAMRDKYQFQWWAVSLVEAQPFAGKKKGADGGIDGLIYFRSDSRTTERAIVSVKGGENVSVPMIRDLKGVLDRENAPIGVFLTLTPPTRPMETEAASAGFYELAGRRYPRLQIITIEQALHGMKPAIPHVDTGAAFKRAGVEEDPQPSLL
jgi:site-specific DNA-methyltransferase (adenine-specific)